MVEYERNPSSEGVGAALRICVVGVGGAGSNVIDRITVDRTMTATLITMQTDVRVLNQSMAPKKLQLGAELMRGVGTGGDPDLGREAALYSKDRVREALAGHDMVFISVGLGGGTGSGAAPVIAEIAKSTGAVVVVFAAVPFSFEGRRRQAQSAEALERLKKCTDALVLFDNNRMGELVLGKEGIQKTFAQADTLIGQSVRAVSGMVGQPSLVKLGLADLVTALRVSDGRCLFGFGEAKGQSRGAEAMKRALKSPLIHGGELLRHARNLLVHIVGGESLTLVEVENIMKQLSRHVPDETQLLFGVSVDARMTESLSVTLISALSQDELTNAPAAPLLDTGKVQLRPAAPAVVSEVQAPTPEPVVPVEAAPVTPPQNIAPPVDLFGELPRSSAATKARIIEHVVPAEAPAEAPASVFAPPPLPHAPGFSLASVIGGGDGGVSSTRTNGTEDARYAPKLAKPTPVEPPMAETAPVMIAPRNPRSVVKAREPQVPTPPVARAPEPEVEEFEPVAVAIEEVAEQPTLFAAPVAAPSLQQTIAAVAAPVRTQEEQPNLRLGSEDRGRFNGTEPAVVQGEDLDTPTWMRLRRRPGK
jgi:cell division protein FtsZ